MVTLALEPSGVKKNRSGPTPIVNRYEATTNKVTIMSSSRTEDWITEGNLRNAIRKDHTRYVRIWYGLSIDMFYQYHEGMYEKVMG